MPELRELLQDALAGSYVIGRELGRGGMATVFLAHDVKHDRTVALKVLRPELAATLGTQRFLREIALTSHLPHPHILPLYDSGESSGFLYYTMPYVEGESLRQRLLREQQLPLDEALRIGAEVADALGHAHAHGVIHRDIKPENILLEGGHAIVADFGVAKAITAAADSEVSSAGMAIGTPTYMSPEQAAATPNLDGRADVYSLGCVVYEMLAGAPPFTGSTAQAVAARHAVDPVPPLRTVRGTVPKAVDEAITTALAKVPADRYASAADFGRALQEAPRRAAAMDWWRSPWWGAAIGIGALALMLLLMRRSSSTSAGTAAVSQEPMRIAVLYLDDKTPDSSLRLFADGLTEELIHELSGLNAFRVISRNGVRSFRDRLVPFDSMVKLLGVTTVIDGSVQRAGDSLHVRVDVIDAASGTNVDNVTVDQPYADFVVLEREVAAKVATSLRRRMGREVRLRDHAAGTTSGRARELVLKARRARDDAATLMSEPRQERPAARAALQRADSLLILAERADPLWLRPLLDRGWVAQERARALAGRERVSALERGLPFAGEALRRDSGSVEALQLRGMLRWDLVAELETDASDSTQLSQAEADLRTTLERDSTLASVWATLSYLLWLKGEFAESAMAAQRALREDAYLTDAHEVYQQLFFSNLMIGDFRQAGEWCRRGRLNSPGDWRFIECALTLLRHDRGARPDPDSAWALVRSLDRLDPPPRAAAAGRAYHTIYRRIVAATISARAGHRDTASAELAWALRETSKDSSLRLDLAYDQAYLLLVLGHRDSARHVLQTLVAARPMLAPPLARDPLFEELR